MTDARAPAPPRVWLASYPRSGNTLLRTILHHCFGLPSTSVYAGDLGGNRALEAMVGHFEGPVPPPGCPPDAPLLVKTHRRPSDDAPAIYVVRDGRAAAVSLWEFYGRRFPLRALIVGGGPHQTWSEHLAAWRPWARPGTLLLRYEELTGDLPGALPKLAAYLGRPVLSDRIPARTDLAALGGRWIGEYSDWRAKASVRDMRLFGIVNGVAMARLGYPLDDGNGVPGAGRGAAASARLARLDALYTALVWRHGRKAYGRVGRRLRRLARVVGRQPGSGPQRCGDG